MFRGHSRDVTFNDAIKFMYSNPSESKKIIDALTELSIEYALNQVKHGVECFQLFETYAGLIPEEMYKELMLPACQRILNSVQEKGIPTILINKAGCVGSFYSYRSLIDIDDDFLQQVNNELDSGKDNKYIESILAGGSKFNSTEIYTNKIKKLLNL